MSSLPAALRRVLLDSPSAIEQLSPDDAQSLDSLLESNGLESAVYARAKSLGETARLSTDRETAWRIAHLMATARASAYGETLDEIRETAEALDIPVRLLPSAQLAYFVHESPEVRPLVTLDVQVPRQRVEELRRALKGRRFFETDDLLDVDYRRHHHLRPMERDGVVVRLHLRTTALLEEAPWDAFPPEAQGLQMLDAESAALCLVCEVWSRGFAHSLAHLRDLRTVLQTLQPSAERLASLVAATDLALETSVVLRVLQQLLGPCVPEGLLAHLEEVTAGPGDRRRIVRLGARLALQAPPAARWISRCHELMRLSAVPRPATAPAWR